jgi:hypothetical protein
MWYVLLMLYCESVFYFHAIVKYGMNSKSDEEDITTVGCSLQKLIPNQHYLMKIQSAVESTHKATILVTLAHGVFPTLFVCGSFENLID